MEERTMELAQTANFATLTTLFPDGSPQTQVMWVDADDGHILINTEKGRAKQVNVGKDPRVAVTIIDGENPYRYVEVRGKVVEQVTGPVARAHIDKLAQKYTGGDYAGQIKTERVLLKIQPEREFVRG